MCQCGYFKKVYQSTIHGANQRLNNAWFIYSKLFFSIPCFCFGVCDPVLHFVFGFWVSFCLIFWDIRLSGLVGDSILGLFVFPFGDSVFLFWIFISQSRLTLGYHFPFCLCVFLCGVSGLCFRVLFFVFYPFGHHIYVLWGKHVIELSRNTTCPANHIDTWNHTLSPLSL